jgi:hypothetical protein
LYDIGIAFSAGVSGMGNSELQVHRSAQAVP